MTVFLGFPCDSDGENPPEMQESWIRPMGWEDPQVMVIPTPVFLPGEFHEQKSLSGYTHGFLKNWTQLRNVHAHFNKGKHTPFTDWSWVYPIRHMLAPSHICIQPNLETSASRASAYNAGHPGLIPGLGILPGEGIGSPGGSDGKKPPEMQESRVQPLGWEDPLATGIPSPVFIPGAFHEHKSLSGYNTWSPIELDTTEQLSLSQGKTHHLP